MLHYALMLCAMVTLTKIIHHLKIRFYTLLKSQHFDLKSRFHDSMHFQMKHNSGPRGWTTINMKEERKWSLYIQLCGRNSQWNALCTMLSCHSFWILHNEWLVAAGVKCWWKHSQETVRPPNVNYVFTEVPGSHWACSAQCVSPAADDKGSDVSVDVILHKEYIISFCLYRTTFGSLTIPQWGGKEMYVFPDSLVQDIYLSFSINLPWICKYFKG